MAQYTFGSQVLALAWTQDCAGLLVVEASAQVHHSGPAADNNLPYWESSSWQSLCHFCIRALQPLFTGQT